MRAKVALKLGLLFVLIIGIGAVIAVVFFTGGPMITEPGQPTAREPGGSLPASEQAGERDVPTVIPDAPTELPAADVADGGPTTTAQLTSTPVSSPTLVNGSEIAFYDSGTGRFFRIDSNGNIVPISDARFPEAQTVKFSDNAEIAAIEFPDGSNVMFDLTTGQQTTLPAHWEEFDFTQNADQVSTKSITDNVDSNALVLTSPDGSRTRAIANLGANQDQVNLNWSPDGEVVAFSTTGKEQSTFGRQEVLLIGTDGDAIGSMIVEGMEFSAVWAPNGTHVLYSVAEATAQEQPSLWYGRGRGDDASAQRRNLNVATWVEKCTFKDDVTVLCAVPREIPQGGGIDHRLVTAADDVFQVNVSTGARRLVGTPATDMQMFDLTVSADGSILYFTDSFGRLNTMRLR